ncbi:unnamed protein product [Prorocentrum cordatum]|uniref:Sugar phosphate transporter domain-containing protein n=1 Tax=Prorocentrum cordatum TaxID=2364126 RepID=A0ABN9X6Q9_9DINO|nr:unnamed protein product [Polarella glacialis]
MAVCSGLALVGRLLCPSAFATGDAKAGTEPLTLRTALRLGVPVAAMQAVGMAAGNVAYMLLSVSFVQMVKAWTSACVYLVGCTMGVHTWSVAVAKTIAVITLGLTLASLGELNFNLLGFFAQVVSLAAEGFRINLLETRLKSNGYRLNPLSSLMVFAPIIMVFLSVMSLLFEPEGVSVTQIEKVGREALLANALLAFFLNISIFVVIQRASGLAFALSGVLKDVLIILGSVIVFDTTLTGTQMLGYSIAVGGLQAYSVVTKAPEAFEAGVVPELWRRLRALGTLAPPKAASAAGSEEQAAELLWQMKQQVARVADIVRVVQTHIIMGVAPFQRELAGFRVLRDVAERVGLDGDDDDAKLPRGSLFELLGVSGDRPIVRVAGISQAAFDDLVEAHGNVKANYRVCDSMAALLPTLEARAKNITEEGEAGSTKAALKEVIDPWLEGAKPLSDSARVLACTANYKIFYRVKPPPLEELTQEQLVALDSVLRSGRVPHADFAVFGPQINRIIFKQVKLVGKTFNPDGAWSMVELFGPESFESRGKSHGLPRSGLVQFGAAPKRGPPSSAGAPPLPPKKPRGNAQGELVHQVQNVKFAANRSGVKFCQAFRTGQCGQTRRNNMCPNGTGEVRQREHCLGAAPAAVDSSGQASLLSQEARASTVPALADPPCGGGRQKLGILVVLAEPEALWGLSGISEHFCKLGEQTAVYDTGGGETCELLAQSVWRELDASPPLRGEAARGIYGFCCLPPEVAERVRVETCAVPLAGRLPWHGGSMELGLPGWALAGARVPGCPSVLKLPVWQAMVDSLAVVASPGVWRAVGAVAERPVRLAHCCAAFTGALEAAAGPAAACVSFAGRFVHAARGNGQSAPEAEAAMVRSSRFSRIDQVSFALPLRQRVPDARAARLAQEAKSVGGVREPLRPLCKAPGFEKVSAEVWAFLIDAFIKDASVHDNDVRADAVRAWAARAGDPGAGVAGWFFTGAPAGVVKAPREDGVFPLASDNEPPCPSGNLAFDALGDASGGESAHLGEEAVEEIKSYASRGWLASATTFEECCERLAGAPALSKFVLLAEVKEGRAKRRLVINLEASSVTAAAAKTHGVSLPGVMGAFGVEWLVVDFDDAFWNVPLAVEERCYFAAKSKQILEGLAIFAGMRVWKQHWCQVRYSFAVESDNIAALAMLSKLRDLSHVPGVADMLADRLSRRYQPGSNWRVPICFDGEVETPTVLRWMGGLLAPSKRRGEITPSRLPMSRRGPPLLRLAALGLAAASGPPAGQAPRAAEAPPPAPRLVTVTASGPQGVRGTSLGMLATFSAEAPPGALPVHVHAGDPLGCADVAGDASGAGLLVVRRGSCTFVRKALVAQRSGAAGVVIISDSEDLQVMGLGNVSGEGEDVSIFAVSVRKSFGDRISAWAEREVQQPLDDAVLLTTALYQPPMVDLAEVVLLFFATFLVAAGAFFATADLRLGSPIAPRKDEVVEVNSEMALSFCVMGSCMLVVLYFFMRYLIYVIITAFCFGGVGSLRRPGGPFRADGHAASRVARHVLVDPPQHRARLVLPGRDRHGLPVLDPALAAPARHEGRVHLALRHVLLRRILGVHLAALFPEERHGVGRHRCGHWRVCPHAAEGAAHRRPVRL